MAASVSYSSKPIHPNAARPAMAFVDLGWLRGFSRSLVSGGAEVFPDELWRFVQQAAQEQSTTQASLGRMYVYDAHAGEPTDEHVRFADYATMRYGSLITDQNGKVRRQKGVDTALVADLVFYGIQRVYEVAHVLSHDTDFLRTLERMSDQGRLLVGYEFEEARAGERYTPEMRGVFDHIVTIPIQATSDLFRTTTVMTSGNWDVDESEHLLTAIHAEGIRTTKRDDRDSIGLVHLSTAIASVVPETPVGTPIITLEALRSGEFGYQTTIFESGGSDKVTTPHVGIREAAEAVAAWANKARDDMI